MRPTVLLLVTVLPAVALVTLLVSTESVASAPPRVRPGDDGSRPSSRTTASVTLELASASREDPAGRPAAQPPPLRSHVPPRWDPAEEERHFKWLRETTPPAELERELDALAETLHRQCATELRSRVAAGEFEPVHADAEGRYPLPPPRRGVVEFLSGGPERGLVRVPIPEAAVPAAYETQRRIDWLRDLLGSRGLRNRGPGY